MRKKRNPLFVVTCLLGFFALLLLTPGGRQEPVTPPAVTNEPSTEPINTRFPNRKPQPPTYRIDKALEMKPIIDVSAWQRPDEIDYDVLSRQISGAIVRIQSGSHTKRDNTATDKNGLDKAFPIHIQEFQKRQVPVAVYAYVTGNSIEAMKKEARSFYQAAHPYYPTFYWLDVEENTMEDMDAGVEAFRKELEDLGAENIGIYIGTYFMTDHSISVDRFDAVWIPTYGTDSGYYNAAPYTDIDYALHQYTSRGYLHGFNHHLDLNIISPQKDPNQIYQHLFTVPD